MGCPSSRWCPFLHTRMDTLFFLFFLSNSGESIQRTMTDSILILFARLKTQCCKSCTCDIVAISEV